MQMAVVGEGMVDTSSKTRAVVTTLNNMLSLYPHGCFIQLRFKGQTDKADRKTDRQTDRQTDRETRYVCQQAHTGLGSSGDGDNPCKRCEQPSECLPRHHGCSVLARGKKPCSTIHTALSDGSQDFGEDGEVRMYNKEG